MPLSSASTLAEVKASYMDNASYEEDGSVSKARAFITACRLLAMMLPTGVGQGSARVELDPKLIADQQKAAQSWLDANATAADGGAGVVALSVENLRQ